MRAMNKWNRHKSEVVHDDQVDLAVRNCVAQFGNTSYNIHKKNYLEKDGVRICKSTIENQLI